MSHVSKRRVPLPRESLRLGKACVMRVSRLTAM